VSAWYVAEPPFDSFVDFFVRYGSDVCRENEESLPALGRGRANAVFGPFGVGDEGVAAGGVDAVAVAWSFTAWLMAAVVVTVVSCRSCDVLALSTRWS